MKKLKYLFFITPLFLVACIRPPVPNVEQAIQSADPNIISPLPNESTDAYFSTALPLQSSPTRGLIYEHIRNNADIEQVEMSMMRLATEFFDPNDYFFREGQYLTRDFVSRILQPFDPDVEDHIGLNPPFGSEHTFDDETVESVSDNSVRPLAYVLEQNFVTINEGEFQLEGVAIAIALNPYHWIRDTATGFEDNLRMTDDEIISVGQDIVEDFLPLLREQEGLEDVPILVGLFILQSYTETISGGFASISYIEEGRSSIDSWESVHERHFRLPDNGINVYDVNINDEFNSFSNTVSNYFPHRYGLIARAHIVETDVYRISITFNMEFFGLSEKVGFHQLLEQEIMNFSPEYDVRILVRSPDILHGSVIRPPFAEEAFVHRNSW